MKKREYIQNVEQKLSQIGIILNLLSSFCKYALTEVDDRTEDDDEWIYFGETIEGDKYFYNKESINWITEDIIEIEEKTIFGENSTFKKETISSLIKKGVLPEKALEVYEEEMLCKIDIKNKKYMILCSIKYNKNGDVLDRADFITFPYWISIVPNTAIEALWKEMYEFQKIKIVSQKREILEKLIEKDPKNPIYYYLLGKEYKDFYHYLLQEYLFEKEYKDFTNEEKAIFTILRILDGGKITSYFALLFEKAVEHLIFIDTFPFEMVIVKNDVIEKEDLFKILKGIFICDLLIVNRYCDKYIKTLEEIKKSIHCSISKKFPCMCSSKIFPLFSE